MKNSAFFARLSDTFQAPEFQRGEINLAGAS